MKKKYERKSDRDGAKQPGLGYTGQDMNRDCRSKTTALGNYIMEMLDEIVSLTDLFHAFPQHTCRQQTGPQR